MEQPAMDSEVVEQPTSEESSNDQIEFDIPNEGSEDQAEEEDEIEVDGRKFALPKSAAEKLKAERLMQADYTRKTQEVAEQRKQIEQQAQHVKQQAELQQQYIADIAEVTAIDKQLAQYAQLNWDALEDSDPVQAMRLQRQYRELQEQKNTAINNLTQKQQQQHWARQQEIAKSLQEGQAVLARDIPNWSPELAKKLVDYGVSTGMSQEQVSSITDPTAVKLLHKAYLYDQLAKKQTTTKPTEQTPPVTRIAAKSSGTTKDPDKMSSDEWLKWRNSQVKRNR